MATYNKEEFQEYLSTKVAESTAKIYATDMAVCVKALEKIKLYEGKELTEILEDFVSHKKAVKNYLQEEFLTALTDIGSNDSGLYDSLLSKAKHYLAMGDSSNSEESNTAKSNEATIIKIKLTGTETDNLGEEVGEYYVDDETIYALEIVDATNLDNNEILQKIIGDENFLKQVWNEWAESTYDYFYIHYIDINGTVYEGDDEVDENFDILSSSYGVKLEKNNGKCINLI